MSKQQASYQQLLLCGFALLLCSFPSFAQMYKWVDANGTTHYSDKKQALGTTKIEEVKVKHSKQQAPAVPKYNPRWIDEEMAFKQNQARKNALEASPQSSKSTKRAWGGDQVETDATRCALARDVLSGAAKHGNGVITDANDKQVAENDIKRYCH